MLPADRNSWRRCTGLLRFLPVLLYVVNAAFHPARTQTANPNEFRIKSYQGRVRCLDYTPGRVGAPVFLNDCARANPVVVEELNDQKHTVILHAGSKVIGILNTGVISPGTPADGEYPLELMNLNATENQGNYFFSLDGDSIILASSRPTPPVNRPVMVVKVKQARGATGTPIVVGPRNLSDDEFWDFLPTNGIDHDPTSGFVRIGYPGDTTCTDAATCGHRLVQVLRSLPYRSDQGWGVVLKLNPAARFDLAAAFDVDVPTPVVLPAGATLRGDRRGTNPGPLLSGGVCGMIPAAFCTGWFIRFVEFDHDYLLHLTGDYARVTGLRLQGPSVDTNTDLPEIFGLFVGPGYDSFGVTTFFATIDHNEMFHWPLAAVSFTGGRDSVTLPQCQSVDACQSSCMALDATPLPTPVWPPQGLVVSNFIHHNEMWGGGYGVDVAGGRVVIAGNVFEMNRHAISGEGSFLNSYTAKFNLVLSASPDYHSIHYGYQQDFDMHGSQNDKNHRGGIAGNEVDIGWNTFFGGNRLNLSLRGLPCATDYFHDNVTAQDMFNYIDTPYPSIIAPHGGTSAPDVSEPYQKLPLQLWMFPNQTSAPDPTARLGVGDFDGDGIDDLFLATGAGWYYSPGGKVAWRFLSAKTEKIDQVLLGDFDGDGRTDVVTVDANHVLSFSWGGASDWQRLNNQISCGGRPYDGMKYLAAGNFTGDTRSDIFFSDGKHWCVSDAGQAGFAIVQDSGYRVPDLRFGDFDGNGYTDVFSVGPKSWQVSYAPSSGSGLFSIWQPLRPKLTNSVQNLIVADFDGNGRSDIATDCKSPGCWRVSYDGNGSWVTYPQPVSLARDLAGVGHFRGIEAKSEDVLTWNGRRQCDQAADPNTLCSAVAAYQRVFSLGGPDMR